MSDFTMNNESVPTLRGSSGEDNTMLGVELLVNQANAVPENKGNGGGHSSGEEVLTQNIDTSSHSPVFFDNDEVNKSPHTEDKRINIQSDDPILNQKSSESNGDYRAIHQMNSQDIKNEKIDLIYKFKKLEQQGIRTTMNYNMNSQLDDMRNEFLKLKKQREVDNSIKFQRKIMMAAITGLEFLNNKFDPFDIKLDGWSESVNENVYDYDEVFEDLAEKYGGSTGDIAPEIKLLMMLGGSAFMFHLTNTMFKSSIPGMDDIMKQNPELMQQFAKAAVSSIGKTSEEMNSQNRPGTNAVQPSERPSQSPPESYRPEMNNDGGLDDIINQMNLQPNNMPDLDNISIISGDTGRVSNTSSRGITLNL